MKKVLLSMLLAVISIASASAQFERGKCYLGAGLDGVGISYSEHNKLHIGLGAHAGYMIEDDFMLIGDLGFNYENKDAQQVIVGGSGRYYIEQNGIFLQLGAHYVHEAPNFNDFTVTPEVGYCFFLNGHLTLEPSVYYNVSCTDFSDKSKFGIKIGLGWYF